MRKSRLYDELTRAEEALTGQELASLVGVTRQVVVHDIALLRAEGIHILSTPRGYLIPKGTEIPNMDVLSVNHRPDQTAFELYTLVDYGVTVIDVQVDHAVYGELKGSLHLSSRRDVDIFLERVHDSKATLLSSLTDGHHLHTVQPPDNQRLQEAIQALRQGGIQVND